MSSANAGGLSSAGKCPPNSTASHTEDISNMHKSSMVSILSLVVSTHNYNRPSCQRSLPASLGSIACSTGSCCTREAGCFGLFDRYTRSPFQLGSGHRWRRQSQRSRWDSTWIRAWESRCWWRLKAQFLVADQTLCTVSIGPFMQSCD